MRQATASALWHPNKLLPRCAFVPRLVEKRLFLQLAAVSRLRWVSLHGCPSTVCLLTALWTASADAAFFALRGWRYVFWLRSLRSAVVVQRGILLPPWSKKACLPHMHRARKTARVSYLGPSNSWVFISVALFFGSARAYSHQPEGCNYSYTRSIEAERDTGRERETDRQPETGRDGHTRVECW